MKQKEDVMKNLTPGEELATYCPHCYNSLNIFHPEKKKVWIKLGIKNKDKRGYLYLSPRVNEFKRFSDIDIVSGDIPEEINCPVCKTSLIEEHGTCEECNTSIIKIGVSVRSKLIDFYICNKAGCDWSGVSKSDEKKIKPKVGRQVKPEQDPMLRTHNFLEVSYGLTRELAEIEANRCLECKHPRCVEGCPVGIDIPGFIKLVKEGRYIDAAHKIKETNSLPAVCGRVCPQEDQCEKLCIVGIKDKPVAIGNLERFVADFERETGSISIPPREQATGFKIAVVGSGPAGLTLAADMSIKGHNVTVFEALHKEGGVLTYGIPEFRLPKKIVESEINYLRKIGVKFELNAVIGNLYTIDELFETGYNAVYLATGAGLPVFMGIEGENLCNIFSANEFLTRANLMKAYNFPDYDTPAPKGRNVAVIGGGNVAMDCARTALRMGSREVTVIYRRTANELPARAEEIHHAIEEGIKFKFLTNPVKYIGDDQGWLKQIECVKMKLGEPDSSGRRRPIPIANSNFLTDIDLAIISVGTGPNPIIFNTSPNLRRNGWGYIDAPNENGRTSIPRVWAGGDIVTGSATVILAMGAARNSANDMHKYLMNKTDKWEYNNPKFKKRRNNG